MVLQKGEIEIGVFLGHSREQGFLFVDSQKLIFYHDNIQEDKRDCFRVRGSMLVTGGVLKWNFLNCNNTKIRYDLDKKKGVVKRW